MEKRIYKINDDDSGQLIWIFGGKKINKAKKQFFFFLIERMDKL